MLARILALFFVVKTHRQSNGLEIEALHVTRLTWVVVGLAWLYTMLYVLSPVDR